LSLHSSAWWKIAQHLTEGGNNLLQAVVLANTGIDNEAPWRDENNLIIPTGYWQGV
jgi:hypothetical protein